MNKDGVQRLGPGDGQRLRDVRLRALADSPDAFHGTLGEEQVMGDGDWTARLTDVRTRYWTAVEDGEDVGLVGAGPHHDDPDTLAVFAMWVSPSARGRGVGGALLAACVEHARSASRRRVSLAVADANTTARMLYARHGFTPSGRTGHYPPPRDHIGEHELWLALPDGRARPRSTVTRRRDTPARPVPGSHSA